MSSSFYPVIALKDDAAKGRERWSWRFDFLLTNIGFVACFQNLWRFPFLCYRNGGAIFLIPYLLCVMLIGVPLLFMEMALGQYTSLGGIKAWKICPLFQGIGVATTVVTWWRNIYDNVILAWAMYYLYSSCIGSELPWASCNNEWNTPTCLDSNNEWACINGTYIAVHKGAAAMYATSDDSESVSSSLNDPWPYVDPNDCGGFPFTTHPAGEFWTNKVLRERESYGFDSVGGIVWHLALTLLLAWMLVYFCLWKGVKWSGKVAYFTAPFIHVLLFVFLIRGATLPGAADGLRYYLEPQAALLRNAKVWFSAVNEVIYSFSIGVGAFTTLGSFNKFHHNFYRDSMIVAYSNVMTSLYGGIVVFSFIGFISVNEGVPVPNVVNAGPALFFEVFPHAFALLPISRLWSILCFFVVLFIGLNSQLVHVKAFVTAIMDIFPTWLRRKQYCQELFVLGVCAVNFLIGLSMVTKGGIYVFTLFDTYGASVFPVVWICFFESIAIGWFYGVMRFSSNIKEMLQWKHIPWYIPFLVVTAPLLSLLVWIGNMATWYPLGYASYIFPLWTNGLGFLMTVSSMLCVPAGMLYHVIRADGPIFTRLKNLLQPSIIPVGDEDEPDGTEMEQIHEEEMS